MHARYKRRRSLLLPILIAVLIVISAGPARSESPTVVRPNIILILTDDLDTSSMDRLDRLKTLLADQGTTFAQFFVSDSLCCPSRSSILCGQYNHNHHVLTNHPPLGGFEKFHEIGNERVTVATWLQGAGYKTVLLGKYLNGYPNTVEKTYVPPGWDEWYSPVEGTPYAEFNYRLNENGLIVAYESANSDYLTDVLARKALRFIMDSVSDTRPFFMYIAPYAPHLPSTPAPRYRDTLSGAKAPRPRSFNEANVSDKPKWVRRIKPLTDWEIKHIDDSYRKRLQSMLAVEDLISNLLQTLAAAGKLDDTYIFFTSDNGYHLGEHRLLEGKQSPYEEDIRVPLIVRGPGVPAGAVREHLAGNIDLAPTFAELAGVLIPDTIDGRSLVPLLGGSPPPQEEWRQGFLLEHTEREPRSHDRSLLSHESSARHNTMSSEPREPMDPLQAQVASSTQGSIPDFEGLRTRDVLYVEYETGEKELYDLKHDPLEMQNLASTADLAVIERLSNWLGLLRQCNGPTCRALENASPAPSRLAIP